VVNVQRSDCTGGPGLRAPAAFLSAALLLLAGAPAAAQQRAPQQQQRTQQPQRPAPAVAAAPGVSIPDQQGIARLVWTTLAAVDHANKTGNYSVLRDLGSPGFQANNTAATLASAFAQIRSQGVDLSDTLLFGPTYEFPPTLISPTVLRIRGRFNMRPTAILFDLLYEWNQGWRLEGVAVAPQSIPTGGTRPN
jgi:hypothetical protein